MIREDKVIIITYKDGSTYTQHRDGTKMFTSGGKDIILVENESLINLLYFLITV